jgi:hypothetical protein
LKEHLLEAKQTLIHVGNPPKKPIIRDKTELLGSQKVGPKSKQLGVKWLAYLVTPSEMGKCQSQHVLLHPKKK